MKDWKIITGFSGSAFVLSFFAGLIGEVSFPILLLRAFAGAVVFGGLGYLAVFVLRRFLPELFENESAVKEEDTDEQDPPKIDIVIDDEEEDAESRGDVAEMEEEISISPGRDVEDIAELVQNDDSDELPGLEAFTDTFSSAGLEQDDGESLTGSGSVDIMGQVEDPGDVAKAIRTIMKKDQEG